MLLLLWVEYGIRRYLLNVGSASNCSMVEESHREKKVKTKRQLDSSKPIIENFIARAPWWGAIVNFVMA